MNQILFGSKAPSTGRELNEDLASTPPHLVHVFPMFGIGGVPIRMSGIINHLGKAYRHTIVTLDGDDRCRTRLRPELNVGFVRSPIRKSGLVGTVRQILGHLRALRPDLLLTYNWGATEWALANTLGGLTPHIHLESGFGPDEADQQIFRRVLFRRLALRGAVRIIVPSHVLHALATGAWRLPPAKVLHIPNGVDCRRFAAGSDDASPSLREEPDEILIGTISPLRPEKNLARLLRVFAMIGASTAVRLVIVGEGAERNFLEKAAAELKVAPRVRFTGGTDAPEDFLRSFDIFAITSDTEQMPNSVLQAMAAGKPIAGVDVGDIRHMVAPENRRFIVPRDDERGLRDALDRLVADKALRDELGSRNAAHARRHYDQEAMFGAYARAIDGCLATAPPRALLGARSLEPEALP